MSAKRDELVIAIENVNQALIAVQKTFASQPVNQQKLDQAVAQLRATCERLAQKRQTFVESLQPRLDLWQAAQDELLEMQTWLGDGVHSTANVARALATIRRDMMLIDGKAGQQLARMAEVIQFGAQYLSSPTGTGKATLAAYLKEKPEFGPTIEPWLEALEFAEGQTTGVGKTIAGDWDERLSIANKAFKLAKALGAGESQEDPLQPAELGQLADLLDFLGDLVPSEGLATDFISKVGPTSAEGVETWDPTGFLPIKMYVVWLKMVVENMDLTGATTHLSRDNLRHLRDAVNDAGMTEFRSNEPAAWGFNATRGLFREIEPLPRLFVGAESPDYDYAADPNKEGYQQVEIDPDNTPKLRVWFKASDTWPLAYAYLVPKIPDVDESSSEKASRRKFSVVSRYEGSTDFEVPKDPGEYQLRLYRTSCEKQFAHYGCPDRPIAWVTMAVKKVVPYQLIPWAGTWRTRAGNTVDVSYREEGGRVQAVFKDIVQSSKDIGFAPGHTLFEGKAWGNSLDVDLAIRWPRDITARCNLKAPGTVKIGTVSYEEKVRKLLISYTVKSVSDTCTEREVAEAFWMTKVQ